MKFSVSDIKGKEVDNIEIPEGTFNDRVNTDVIHQAIVMYQASLRQGNVSTKERADVSGGGKKPYRQKGTGRARAGSSRSPLWHSGGVTFGPHPRDFGYTIPKKIKTAALRESINAKYKDKELFCINDIKDSLNKTKEFAQILTSLHIKGKTLAVLDGSDPSITKVSRNISLLTLARAKDITAYDVLKNKNLLVTKTALNNILDRIKK